MRRSSPLLLCLAALAGVVAPASAAPPPPLAAELTACVRSADPAGRSAAFTARMPALPGTRRMAMRFDLLGRTSPRAGFTPVRVPRWGVWQRSRRGVAGFVFTKNVSALQAPAEYRAVVRFRWLDARGRVQRRARRQTRACRQPDLRPNLRVRALSAAPGPTPETATYRFVVVNRGRGPAGPFSVALGAGGADVPLQRVAGLAAGARLPVVLTAARCAPRSVLRAVADEAAEVVETSESDNVTRARCALGGPGADATIDGR